jgi:hypothetical protein
MNIGGGFLGVVQSAVSVASTSGPNNATTSYTTVAEMDVTLNNLTIGNLLVAFFDGDFFHGTAGQQTNFGLSLDGAAESDGTNPNATGSNYIFPVHMMGMWTVSATSHNVKARYKATAGTLTGFSLARKLRLLELRTG